MRWLFVDIARACVYVVCIKRLVCEECQVDEVFSCEMINA